MGGEGGDRWEDEKGRPWVDFGAADKARKMMQDWLNRKQPQPQPQPPKEEKGQKHGEEEARRKPEENSKT
jgi:hypothetical protein